MGLWDALSSIMGTPWVRRIGSREAEQLLGGDPTRSAYPELSDLLAAAAAPPRREELVGLRSAVAAFEAAGQDGFETAGLPGFEAPGQRGEVSVAVPGRRRAFARSIVLKAAAGVAVVLFGGTALAAEAGILPGGAQQHAHDVFSALGVPPPGTPAPSASFPVRPVTPTSSPSFGSQAATPATPGAVAPGLCRSWAAQQQNPKKKPLKAKALRDLADAAGGADRIAAFCAQLLGTGPGETAASASATASPTATHPGNAKGHSKATATGKPHKNG